MSQSPVEITATSQFLAKITITSQLLEKITAIVRLNLIVMMWNTLKSQENRKVKNWLSFENSLSQENQKAKNC